MFVRRLVQWLTGVFSSMRPARLLAVTKSSAETSTTATAPLVTSWLAAARLLRPMRGVPMATVAGLRERPVPARLRSGLIGREQVAAGRSRPLEPTPQTQPPSRGDQVSQQQTAQAAPQSQPLAPLQELPAFEPAPDPREDAALYRQLAAFKQLVRLGVYNEGFRRDALPDQYARGMRPDDDLTAGDDQN